jgi:predicted phage gp36 major capsid-like protein
MPETPLGKIVSIRAEKDPKTLKNFTKEQRKIRNDWMRRQFDVNRASPEQIKKSIEELQALARSFQ